MARPKLNSSSEQQLKDAKDQFDSFDDQVKSMTLDNMNQAPKLETEQQTKLSQKELERSKDIYLKPEKSLGPGVNSKTGDREMFNEKFREEYNFAKEYVQFIAENNEIIGETIEIWTKPYPGTNLEFWKVPTNKPIWGPRYLAEQIKKRTYHRLVMDNRTAGYGEHGEFFGTMVAKNTIQRLDARPVSSRRSVFMGSNAF
jgi:hypothetical protein